MNNENKYKNRTYFKRIISIFFLLMMVINIMGALYTGRGGSIATFNNNILVTSDLFPKSAAFSPPVDNVEYNENLNLFIEKNGEFYYDYDFQDDGLNKTHFPVSLPVPLNLSYDGIIDAIIDLDIMDVSPMDKERGVFSPTYTLTDHFGLYDHIGVVFTIYMTNADDSA
ncbi:MAG: hypothetical protein ACTSVC_05760, partial [Promethearchaeota archaeon]